MPVSSGGFPQAIRVLRYSRTEARMAVCFHVRDYHPLGCRFPAASINKQLCDIPRINTTLLPYNPVAPRYARRECIMEHATWNIQNPVFHPTCSIFHISFVSNTVRNDGLGFSAFARRYWRNIHPNTNFGIVASCFRNLCCAMYIASPESNPLTNVLRATKHNAKVGVRASSFLLLLVLKCFTSQGMLARSAEIRNSNIETRNKPRKSQIRNSKRGLRLGFSLFEI